MIIDNRTMWSSLKTRTVTVSVQPVYHPGYIFRVSRLVQMGMRGREMIFLSSFDDHLPHQEKETPSLFSNAMFSQTVRKHAVALSLPQRCDNFDFIYTGNNMTPVMDVHAAINSLQKCATVGSITPEVLAPGDFLVFKPKSCNRKARLAEALRLIAH